MPRRQAQSENGAAHVPAVDADAILRCSTRMSRAETSIQLPMDGSSIPLQRSGDVME